MTIGLSVDGLNIVLGEGQFLESFFSTICVRLEGGKLGSVYPNIMEDFYDGNLQADKVKKGLNELKEIEKKMLGMKPTDLIMDMVNPNLKQVIPSEALNLKDCFFSKSGRDLIKFLYKYFNFAIEENSNIKIISLTHLPILEDKPQEGITKVYYYNTKKKTENN